MIVTTLVFTISIFGLQLIPKLFFPPSDRSYFKIELELPVGTSIEATESVVVRVETFVKQELSVSHERTQGITNWVSYIGNGVPIFLLTHNPKPRSSNYALIVVNVSGVDVID